MSDSTAVQDPTTPPPAPEVQSRTITGYDRETTCFSVMGPVEDPADKLIVRCAAVLGTREIPRLSIEEQRAVVEKRVARTLKAKSSCRRCTGRGHIGYITKLENAPTSQEGVTTTLEVVCKVPCSCLRPR